MPRAPAVLYEEAVQLVEKFIQYCKRSEYPQWSAEVWGKMRPAISERWSRDAVYTNICENRLSIVSTACANLDIVPCVSIQSFATFRGIQVKLLSKRLCLLVLQVLFATAKPPNYSFEVQEEKILERRHFLKGVTTY